MKSGRATIYIFLERGVEDIALLAEIHTIIAKLKISSVRDVIKNYPTLYKLKDKLSAEIYDQNQLLDE